MPEPYTPSLDALREDYLRHESRDPAEFERAIEAVRQEERGNGLPLGEVREAMIPVGDGWDGDESEQSIVLRFIAHYAALDGAVTAAREAADYEDDAEILFRWDAEAGELVHFDSASIRLAERERCAQIADHVGHLWSGTGSIAAFQVADKIRAVVSTPEPTDQEPSK